LDFFRELPALLVLAKPEQVIGELSLRRQEIRVKLQRRSLILDALGEAIFLGKLSANEMRHGWILRP
jgi:hypothetical protein